MSFVITRTLMLGEVVTPEGDLRCRVPVFAGQRLFVRAETGESRGCKQACEAVLRENCEWSRRIPLR